MILASASARRASILEALGIPFSVHPPDIGETLVPGESAERHAERLAREKALAGSRLYPGELVVGGDTIVTIDGDILGKPGNRDEAVDMLMRLSGRTHRVISGLALAITEPATPTSDLAEAEAQTVSGVQVTEVTFHAFDRRTVLAYAKTGEPMDKAGAYGIQGFGAALVERIDGDYTGVVGLPVPLLLTLMERVGRPYRFPEMSGGD